MLLDATWPAQSLGVGIVTNKFQKVQRISQMAAVCQKKKGSLQSLTKSVWVKNVELIKLDPIKRKLKKQLFFRVF